MHVKTAADSSQLCQQRLGCSTESASDRVFPPQLEMENTTANPPPYPKAAKSCRAHLETEAAV